MNAGRKPPSRGIPGQAAPPGAAWLLCVLVSGALGAPAGPAAAPASAGAAREKAPGSSPAAAAAPVRLEVGPDRIACGVTAPLPSRGAKPGLVLWFHGGMRSPNREKGLEAHRPLIHFLDPARHVLASPSAFAGRDWLGPGALATIEALIDTLRALHPIAPDDLTLVGVSDGCLAVIRYGLEGRHRARRKILVSSLPQLALRPEDLARPRLAEGRWDFFQGGRDRLFPAAQVKPFLEAWTARHANATLHFHPDGEHDFGWYAVHAAPALRQALASPAGLKPQKPKKG